MVYTTRIDGDRIDGINHYQLTKFTAIFFMFEHERKWFVWSYRLWDVDYYVKLSVSI